MITVQKTEHELMVASAEATLIAKCLSANERMKQGEDIHKLSTPISVAFCNLVALEHYDTGRFESAEYFNVMDPTHISASFSNVNTINTQ